MDVFCEICGHRWDSRDPDVTYWHGDGAWECADEGLCFERRAMRLLDEEVSGG
jgi:hypothetical protein